MKKLLILVHRYVGIAISLLMAAWCLSGIVMMYVGYPALEEEERVAGLPPLSLDGCCEFERTLANVGDVSIDAFAVEMLAGRPVLRIGTGSVIADLRTGEIVDGVGQEEAQQVAKEYQQAHGIAGSPAFVDIVDTNQWTVTGAYNAYRPMYRFALGDEQRTELYVAGPTGEVVLDTTARERFWNWFGAVTHWLYPTILRQNGAVWSQVVIWTSGVGAFLTVTGLWLGILQFRAGHGRTFSPYAGWNWWHHVSGLVFGILTLTWVVSGLISMNPGGWLGGSSGRPEYERLRDLEFTSRDAVLAISRWVEKGGEGSVVQIVSAPFAGLLYLNAQTVEDRSRFDAQSLEQAPLDEAGLRRAADRLQPGQPIMSAELLNAGDAYYYDYRDGRRRFPVYRVILGDAEETRYYMDPFDGRLLQKTDRDRRWYRWLFEGFHRWDFSAGLRQRPWWDLIVLPLMFGVTALSITGVYLGFRRVKPKR